MHANMAPESVLVRDLVHTASLGSSLYGSATALSAAVVVALCVLVVVVRTGKAASVPRFLLPLPFSLTPQGRAAPRPRPRRRRVLLLGLDNAGKSSLGQALSLGDASRRWSHSSPSAWPSKPTRPEHHVLHHHFDLQGLAVDVVDPCHPADALSLRRIRCGHGQVGVPVLWDELLRGRPDAVVFVVDAADRRRLSEAHDALHWVLRHPSASTMPVLVLGSKADLPGALDDWQLRQGLGLTGLSAGQRQALLGDDCGPLPMALRRRIADFHPDVASSAPHGSSISVLTYSVGRRRSLDTGVRWLAEQLGCASRPTSHHGRLRFLCTSGVLEIGARALRCSATVSHQAALLPLFCA